MSAEPRATRGWTRFGVLYFVFATALLIWPIYPAIGNRIEPRVLGLPFSLVYVLGVLVLNTLVLAALYRARVIDSDEGHDRSPGPSPSPSPSPGPGPGPEPFPDPTPSGPRGEHD